MDQQDASPPPPEDIPPVSAEELVGGDERPDDIRRYPSTIGGALYLCVLAVVVGGIGIVLWVDWRIGTRIIAGGLGAAALFRLVLRERDAGMLAVRNRFLDAFMLAGVGGVLAFLASSIPNQPGM